MVADFFGLSSFDESEQLYEPERIKVSEQDGLEAIDECATLDNKDIEGGDVVEIFKSASSSS